MKKALKYNIYLIPVFLLAAISFPIFAWFGILSLDDNNGDWFQRSGSLVVLCAAIIEYILFRINISATPASGDKTASGSDRKTSAMYLRYILALKYITAVVAIVGTIIWGYGDLIFAIFM